MTKLFVGDHAETLASGRRVAPGEELPNSAIDTENPVDQRLIADGVLVEAGNAGANDEDLGALNRDELNARATALGVEDADALPNKDAVIAAIQDKETTQ